jgi:hypothetical protein
MRKSSILLIVSCALLITGCTAKDVQVEDNNQEKDSKDTPISIEEPSNTEELSNTEEPSALKECIALLGKTDEEVMVAFGGGEENKTNDGYLIGRKYLTQLFNEEVTLYTSYRQDGVVNVVSTELTEKSFDEYIQLLENSFGKAFESSDVPSEGGSIHTQWLIDGKFITLYNSYGMINLEFVMPDELSVVESELVRGLSDTIVNQMAETDKYPDLERLIIDTFEIPEDYFESTKYYYNYVDLNFDGKDEIFVVVMGPYTSGTGGSSALIVYPVEDQLHVKQKFTLMQTPIIISEEMTDGAHEIIVYRSGGGIEEGYVRLTCSDGEYTSVNDGVPVDSLDGIYGTAIISNDLLEDIKNGTFLTLK